MHEELKESLVAFPSRVLFACPLNTQILFILIILLIIVHQLLQNEFVRKKLLNMLNMQRAHFDSHNLYIS